MENRRSIVWVIGGGYLIYLAYQIIRDVVAEKPDSAFIWLAFAALFIFVGAFAIIRSVREFIAKARSENEESTIEKTQADEVEGESSEEAEVLEEKEETSEGMDLMENKEETAKEPEDLESGRFVSEESETEKDRKESEE